jgi:hypothetical protein
MDGMDALKGASIPSINTHLKNIVSFRMAYTSKPFGLMNAMAPAM